MGAKARTVRAGMTTVLKALIDYLQRDGVKRFAQALVKLFGGVGQCSEHDIQALGLSSER